MRVHAGGRRLSLLRGTTTTFFLLFLSLQSESVTAPPPPFSCEPTNLSTKNLPFCDHELPIETRAKDLVSRLTLDEKVLQLVNTAEAVPRLNVSAYEWWSEALHGVSRHGRGISFDGAIASATMFPQIILTAASFDSRLWYRVAQAIGEESRAVYNAGQAKGMTFWAPNINIFRDPRWGRGQETPGEDPLVAGKYAVAYVRGIQGDSFEGGQLLQDGHLKASACCKHYAAHDLDNWKGVTRYIFDAKVSKQDLSDTYQPPFKACVQEGKASGIMCAYNRVNGVPSCADYNLLTKTARKQWGFQGYIASDCDAVAIIHDAQGYAKEPEDAVADVLKAGMDVNCGSYMKKYTKSAVAKNKALELDIDRALHNLFSIRMRLGLFNGDPTKLEYGKIGPAEVCSPKHQDLALEAAKSGIVLLKNKAGLLPFPKSQNISIAIIGPHANNTDAFLGNYEGRPCRNITILQALGRYIPRPSSLLYNKGCDFVNCSSASLDEAVGLAKQADYVVLVMGLDQTIEREKLDRLELGLPGNQEKFITSVAKAAKRPVALVLLCGGPVDISFAKGDKRIGSILWAGYPGEAGGIAVVETLFGDHNPGGRLPVTWYPKDFAKVPMTDMRMRPDLSTGYPGRTYRFYNGPKVFEFGYGLSYTKHSYKFISVTPSKLFLNVSSSVEQSGPVRSVLVSDLQGAESCDSITFSAKLRVHNRGEMAGKQPALLFIRNDQGDTESPRKRLVGFQSVSLGPGESREIEYAVSPCEHLSHANEDGAMMIEEGTMHLAVGDDEYPFNVMF